MAYKIDLHVHSKYSGDTNADPEDTVICAIQKGLHGLAFTEHYSYEASEHAEDLREKYRSKLLILRGVEFSATEGHCLVFGVNTDKIIPRNSGIDHVVQIVSEHGGVVIPTHPFRPGNSMGDLVTSLTGIVALEGYNGYSHHSQNVKAIETAEKLSLPFTGGSDAHESQEVGACYTDFFEPVTENNFITILREGNYTGIDTRKVSKAWMF